MKVYARQIAPEQQESPLFLDGFFPNNIILDGNRDYNKHTTPEYDMILRHFDSMVQEWDNRAYSGYTTLAEILQDFGFVRNDGKPWTTKQRGQWRKLMEQSYSEDEVILAALELLTGKKWKSGTIRGCSQGDWQDIFYPVDEWSKAALECFEMEYFNTGTEWMVHDEAEEPEIPEDISGYCQYCYGWNSDLIRAEIAEAAGVKPEDVVLYEFSGYSKSPVYSIA